MPVKLSQLSWRDLLVVGVPALLLIALAFWGAAQFIKPAPPDTLTISTGGEGGAYQRFAARYRDVLARYGVRLIEKPSAGALDNLARLRDDKVDVDVAFVQGGSGEPREDDALLALGDMYHEPLWIFYRPAALGGREASRLPDLKGLRIAIGGAGSGTQRLALDMLSANGLDAHNTRLVNEGGFEVAGRLQQGQVDAVFAVGPTQSSLIWALLYTPGVRLMSLDHAAAYTRRFPHLAQLTLPRGAIDLAQDIPPRDVSLVAPMATLLAREDTHPALVGLLLQAASEVHGGSGVFQRPGEFPRTSQGAFPMSPEAERYYRSGKPFLQRYLPFWAATLVDRLVVMVVPLLAVLVPLFKFAPQLYGWRVRARIYRRYGELKFLESEVEEHPERLSRAEWLERLDRIERAVNRLPTPLSFADMLYTLRGHIDLVRRTVLHRTAPATGGVTSGESSPAGPSSSAGG